MIVLVRFFVRLAVWDRFLGPLRPLLGPFWSAPGTMFGLLGACPRVVAAVLGPCSRVVAVLRSLLRPAHPFFSVSLDEIGKLAEYYVKLTPSSRVCVSTVHTNETTCEKFRRQAASTLRNGGMVIVNFSRARAGYTTSPFAGHMSPIVAYNKDNDSVLLMDVAIKSWEPVWIPVSSLFDAMDTVAEPRNPSKDTSSKRGFILFERV